MKKFLSILCSVMMLINSVPFTAFAEEPVQADPPAVIEQQEEIIAEPVEVPVEIPADPEPVVVPAEEPVDIPAEEPVDIPAEEPVVVPAEEPVVVPAEEPVVVPEEPQEEPEEEPAPAPAPVEEPVVVPAENGEGTSSEVPADNSGEGQAVVTEPGTGTEPAAEVVTPAEPAVVEPEIIPNDVDGTIDNEGSYAGGFDHNFPTQLVRLNMTYGRKLRFASRGMDVYVNMQSEDDPNEAPITLILWDALTQGPGQDFSQIEYVHTGSWLMTIMPMQAGANGGFRLMVSEYKEKEVVIEPAVTENTAGSEKEKEEPEIEPVITPVEPEVLTPVEVEVEEEPTPEVVPVVTNENEGTDPVLDGTDDTDETGKDVPDENKNPEDVIIEEEIEEEEIEEVVIEEPVDVVEETEETEETEEVTGSEPKDGEDEEEAAEGEEGEKTEGESEEGEVPSEEVTEEETEETEEEIPEVAMPAATLNASMEDSTVITANIPEGALPEGVQMRAVKMDVQEAAVKVLVQNGYSAADAAQAIKTLVEQGTDLTEYVAAYDVCFYLPENPDEEIEPALGVEVSFDKVAIAAEYSSQIEAYHVSDNGQVDTLNTDAAAANGEVTVTIVTDTFSPLILSNPKGLMDAANGAQQEGEETPTLRGTGDWPQDLINVAEGYYGENGHCEDRPPVYVNIDHGPSLYHNGPEIATDAILAGQELYYHLEVGLGQAYNYTNKEYYDEPLPLYDDFKSVVLTVTLPAGLILNENGYNYPMTSAPNDRDVTKSHTYTIELPKDENGHYPVHNEGFDLKIFVGNNGTADSITSYNLSNCISLTGTFDILDKTTPAPYATVATYTKTDTAGMGTISTKSPDVWGVNKSETKEPVIDETANTVTFEWQIDIGLVDTSKGNNGKDENGRSILKDDSAQYTREGATELTSLTLKDTIKQYIDSAFDDTMTPSNVTIQKTGNGTTPVDITSTLGSNLTVWGSGANSALKMTESESPVLDINGDKTADVKTPLYTSYIVKAVYNVEDLIIEFYDSPVKNLKANNQADITAKLADISPDQTDSDNANSDTDLYKKKPAKVDIVKKLQTLNSGTNDYNNEYGPITYTITASDSFKLYTYDSDNKKYDEVSSGTSHTITDITKSYYVMPGNYSITETIDPNHANEMSFDSVIADKGDDNPISGTAADGVTFNALRNDDWTVTFKNKESKGKIIITKNDQDGQPLENVKFQLKDSNGQIVKWIDDNHVEHDEMTTNNSGKGTYDNLPFGTYTLEETEPRPGYTKDGDWPMRIVIGDGVGEYITYEPIYTNTKTKATLTLTKYVGYTQAEATNFPVAGTNNKNCGTFVLQRTTAANPAESDWETVTTDIDGKTISTSLNDNSKIIADVAAKDGDGNSYKYRFVETVASGYYPVVTTLAEDGTTIIYTNKPNDTTAVSLTKTVEPGGSQTFKMYNRKKVAVQVYKHYYHYKTDGSTTNAKVSTGSGTSEVVYHVSTADWTVPVTLYRYAGTGNPTSVDQLTAISTKDAKSTSTAESPTAKWDDLVVYDTSATYTYYVKETLPTTGNGSDYTYFGLNPADNYESDYIELGGEKYVKIDTTTSRSTYMVGFRNYLDAIPIRVRKIEGETGLKPLGGCTVTIYTDPDCADEHIAYDAQTGKKLEKVTMPGDNTTGQYIYLESGKKYYYKEIDIASGYTFLNMITDNSSTYTDSTTTTNTNLGTIDLTGLKQPEMSGKTTKYKTYTVRNKKNPGVKFTKKTMGQQKNLSGAKFAIFTRTGTAGNYTYTFVKDVTIGSEGTTESLAAGTYYVAEVQMGTSDAYASGFLNPNSANAAAEYTRVATKYGRKVDGTNVISYTYVENPHFVGYTLPSGLTGLTFTEITVTDPPKDFTFYNIYLKEKVQVQKTIDGTDASVAGFTVQIYKAGADGNPTGDPVKSVQTNSNGIAQFDDLDLYDENGERITYVVKEGPAEGWGNSPETHADLVSKYYFVSDGQKFQLEVQQSGSDYNTTDLDGNTLKVNNATNISIKATKYQRDGWQWAHGGLEFTMEGAKFGLYRRAVGGSAWEPVRDADSNLVTALSDRNGQISFSNLPRGTGTGTSAVQYEYAIVELASNDPQYFPYQENPLDGDNPWKAYPAEGVSIPNDDLSKYNAQTLTIDKISIANKEYELDDLFNSNHWVQFHLKKWIDSHPKHDYYVDGQLKKGNVGLGIGDENGDRRYTGHPEERPPQTGDKALDDCAFSLYRYILPDGVNSVAFDRNTWTLIGTYTSGGLLDADNNPVPGELLTDIDKGINDNYVYVLVEDNVGPNSCIINPHYQYTFWYSENHTPAVTCTNIDRAFPYTMDTGANSTVNHTDVLNSWEAGTGDGDILLAALRLAKWKDTFDELGHHKQEYVPLTDVQFTVSLTTGEVIAELTTGLGNTPAATAQSGVFQLAFGTGENAEKVYLKEYEVPSPKPKSYEVTNIIVELTDPDHSNYTIYGIPVNVKETGTPDGYGYFEDDYQTYLVFVDKNEGGSGGTKYRYYSDLYFVTTTDTTIHLAEYQDGWLWHVTNAEQNTESFGESLQRIVDYPMVNTYVEIRKVGYIPTAATVTLANAESTGAKYSELLAKGNYGAIPLSGITMKLKRYDEDSTAAAEEDKWKDWDYSAGQHGDWGTKTFTTLSEGEFIIPNGLKMGKYRVYEIKPENDNSVYEYAYLESEGHYREFTVGGVGMTVYMANPKKLNLKITKKNMGTDALVTGMKFKLGSLESEEPTAGTYTFSNIPTGKYTLSEPTAPANISTTNFAAWFAAAYPDLAALVSSAGMIIGYTYGTPGADGNKDVNITAIAPWDSSTNKVIELEIKNPAKTNITLKKYDLEDKGNTTPLNGASFEYFYKPFGTLSGDVSVNLPEITDGTATSDVKDIFDDDDWEYKGALSLTRDELLANQEPGIYAFYETGAPAGYERLVVDNKIVIYTAVVTGGLPVNVTVTPNEVTVDENKVPTNFESTTGAAVEVAAKDPRKATLKAKKTVNAGDLANSDIGNWSVTLNLYDQETEGTIIGTATINKGTNQGDGVVFKKGTSTAYFSVGKTYYLEEVVNVTDDTYADAAHFILTTVKIGDTVITLQEGKERYAIPVESVDGFTIDVTNQYLYGRVDFRKYDERTEYLLSGAEFEVLHEVDGKWVVIPGSKVEEINGSGRYKAFIPLDSANETTYRIHETVPPPQYTINPDPTKDFIAVELKFDPETDPHGNKKDFTIGDPVPGTYLNNAKGNPLEIIKYNNVKGAASIAVAAKKTIKFSLYHYDTHQDPAVWVFVAEESIEGDDGKIVFDGVNLLAPYEQYAIAETYANPTLFNRLDGIYIGNDKQTLLPYIDAVYNTATGTEVRRIENVFSFVNRNYSGTISFNAYNVPYLKPTITKLDVGNYPEGVFAQMDFKVFEVASNFVATQTSVEDLVANCTTTEVGQVPRIVFQGNTSLNNKVTNKEYPAGSGNAYQGTTITWQNDTTVANRWDPAKTYILVETRVFGSETYDTMVKDDPRVTWYYQIQPVAQPTGTEEFILANINGTANVYLTKSVVPSNKTSVEEAADTDNAVVGTNVGTESEKFEVESLLKGNRNIEYTLAPRVTGKNQMLKSFKLVENGLTEGEPAAPDYEIKAVKVGSATQVLPAALGLSSVPPIQADVAFYNKTNGSVGGGTLLDTYTNVVFDTPLLAPAGTKSFEITYYSPKITEVAPPYTLAEQFTPSATHVYMTVKKIPDGYVDDQGTHPATEITQFTNKSEAKLNYDKWTDTGSGKDPQNLTAEDTAVINVTKLKLPLIQVHKESNTSTAYAHSIVKYTLRITNKEDSPVDFVNPVLIDVLPTGVTLYTAEHEPAVGTGHLGETFGLDYASREGTQRPPVTHEGVEYSDAEHAVIFYLTGKLHPNSYVDVTFDAYVNESAIAYTTLDENDPNAKAKIRNDVYLSSTVHTYHTTDNPYGYSFAVNATGTGYTFGKKIEEAAINDDDGTAAIQESGVHNYLPDTLHPFTTPSEYVWISDFDEIPIVIGNKLNLRKAVKGDQDPGFHETGVGIATRNVYPFTPTHDEVTKGAVDWKLQINNGYDDPALDIVVGDAIPRVGDDQNRESQWGVIFDSITEITNNNAVVPASMYTLWYYTGPIVGASAEVQTALKEVRTWTGTTHGDWSTTAPVTDDDKEAITAFMIVFKGGNNGVIIKAGHTAIITYHTKVQNYRDDIDFERYRAFQNATNDFFVKYSGYSLVQPSNPVSVTLMDGNVQVEGDVWIDEDWDDTQQEGGNRRDYSQYDIVTNLAGAIGFNITDKRNNNSRGEDADHGTNTDPGYGESVRHFTFTNLGAAYHVAGRPLYDSNNVLNVSALKGTEPIRYTLDAAITDGSLLNIFELVNRGTGHYMSDDPDVDLTASAANSLDSNFSQVSAGSYDTYPFYLRYSDKWDQSKDIGFRSYRNLELTKVAQDNPNLKLPNAEFEIYGPFGDSDMPQKEGPNKSERTEAVASGNPLKFTKTPVGEGENAHDVYTLDPKGTVTKLKTDAKGKLYVNGLNWWKEYDIVETTAPTGYIKEGTTIDPDTSLNTRIINRGNGVFTLMVPGTAKTNGTDAVTVKNPRKVIVPLDVEKIFKSDTPLDNFKFTFDLTLSSINGTTVENALKMDPIPEIFKLNDHLYDESGAAFIIETKTIPETKPNPEDEDKLHTVYDAQQKIGIASLIAHFTPLELFGIGTYVFNITERNPNAATGTYGLHYDSILTRTATVTVQWSDSEGKLVAAVEYSDSGTGATAAKFTNRYDAVGDYTPEVKKVLNGRTLAADEFEFTITEVNGNNLQTAQPVTGGHTETVSNGVPGDTSKVAFTTITYHLSDFDLDNQGHRVQDTEKYYKFEEVIPRDAVKQTDGTYVKNGITYSTEKYIVTVTLHDNGDGTITADAQPDDLEDLKFTNTYRAKGDYQPKTRKELEGRILRDGEFTFKITEVVSATNSSPVLNPEGQVKYTQTVTNVGNTVTFPVITYTLADMNKDPNNGVDAIDTDHFYLVEEIAPQNPDNGLTYDGKKVTIKVTLHDNRIGTIIATPDKKLGDVLTPATDLIFRNKYNATGSIQFKGLKFVQYRDFIDGDVITFKLEAADGTPMPAGSTKDDATGIWSTTHTRNPKTGTDEDYWFGIINYSLANITEDEDPVTHQRSASFDYKITESVCQMAVKDSEGNVIGDVVKDTAEYHITVTITDDTTAHPGHLEVAVTKCEKVKAGEPTIDMLNPAAGQKEKITVTGNGITPDAQGSRLVTVTGLDFTNPYHTTAKLNIEALKVLNGRDMVEGEFTFTLKPNDGQLTGDAAKYANDAAFTSTLHNGAGGKVIFPTLNFAVNPDDVDTTGMDPAPAFWDVKDLMSIAAPVPRIVNLTLTENATTNMPIGVMPHGFTIPYSVDVTIPVVMTITYNRTTGILEATINPTNADLNFVNDYVTTHTAVHKDWDDDDDRDGVRPDHINVHLFWSHPDVDSEKPQPITSLLQKMRDQYPGNAIPAYVQELESRMLASYELNEGNNWTLMIDKLPKCWNGKKITYSWTEDAVKNYTPQNTIIKETEDGNLYIFINHHDNDVTKVSVEKVWKDNNNGARKRPTSVTVQLYADGVAERAPITLNAGNGWSYEWTGLLQHKNHGQQDIQYTVAELDVPDDYEVEVTGDMKTKYTITNTMPEGDAIIRKVFIATPEEPIFNPGLMNIPVVKTWNDNNNAAGARPGAITVHLYAGGIEVASQQMSEATEWRITFFDLPIYNENEEEIEYFVTEDPVPGYIGEVDGYNLINTYQPEAVSVAVQKIWADQNNAQGLRPASIRMTLSNGMSVVLSEANSWTAVISGLPATINGQPANYTWSEPAVPGYTLTSVQTGGSVTVFTNTTFQRPPQPGPVPPVPGRPVYVFEEYETPLGIAVEINHVGDCFD